MTSYESEDEIVIIPPTIQSKCHLCDQIPYNKLCEHIFVHMWCWHENKAISEFPGIISTMSAFFLILQCI